MSNRTAGGGSQRALRSLILVAALVPICTRAAAARKPPAPRQDAAGGTTARITDATGASQGALLGADGRGIATLLAATDDITRQLVALRGLKPERPIERGVLSRAEIGARLKERIGKEYTPDEIRIESRVLKRLGLLPPDVDYEQLLLDLLMEQVAGFYDPYARRLYIADWLGIDLQRPALAHEIEHALQDQHFDLKAFATPIKEDGDRQLARSALVEGDGTAAMLEFFAQSLGIDVTHVAGLGDSLGKQLAGGMLSQSPVFTRAPRFLRETLLFPYFAGLNFVLALHKGQPWSRVDDAFRAPPESTEQVLHPDKYVARERPVPVTPAPIAALAPRQELRRDVLGELEFRVLLASRLPDGTAERAAEGWGGDRLVAWGEPEEEGRRAAVPVVIDLSTWDSDEDAREAEAALRQLMARQTGKPDPKSDTKDLQNESRTTFEVNGEAWAVERRGREVLALFGVPVERRQAVADEVWAKWKVGTATASAQRRAR